MTLSEAKKVKLSEHFTLYEAIYSRKAIDLNIDNEPNKYIINNLTQICKTVLEPIRKRYGKPIVITSGYRSIKLNAIVGGSSTSQHKHGTAIDFHPQDKNDMKLLWNLILDMIRDGEIECRQLIDEYNLSWIHISINDKYHSYKQNDILHLK